MQQREENIERNGQTETRRSNPPCLHKKQINILRQRKRNVDRHRDYAEETRTVTGRESQRKHAFGDEDLKK